MCSFDFRTARTGLALLAASSSLLLGPVRLGAPAEAREGIATLKSLYEAHRWFGLRDSVRSGAPPFYEGAVACAFNEVHRCEETLKPVIESSPRSDEAIEAHRLLASAYFRSAKYHEALVHVAAVLAARPGDPDARSERPLLAALADFPDQAVVRRGLTRVRLSDAGLPFSINGVQGTYWFDTGADISVLSESEAKRFGLRVMAAPIQEGDVNGTQVNSRVAVADELSVGSILLEHVGFLVVPDSQPPFNQLPPGSRGLIGMPVLLAFRRFAVWGAESGLPLHGQQEGEFEIGSRPPNGLAPHADLCFDGHHPVARVRFGGQNLAFTLDTGATNTDLYPPFAKAFPKLIRASAKTDSYKMEGVGGAKYMAAAILPILHFNVGGFPVVLKSAGVLLTPTTQTSKFFEGNLGNDLLQQAKEITFDFDSMALTLR